MLWITERAFLVEESGDMYRFQNHDYIAANIQTMNEQEHVLILVQLLGSDTPIAGLLFSEVRWLPAIVSN
jgi:hypothetical protein